MATPDKCKPMWELLLKKRDRMLEVIAVMDDSDGWRAMSVAMAICDAMGLPRTETLRRVDEAWQAGAKDKPPLPHVYQQARKARGLVKS